MRCAWRPGELISNQSNQSRPSPFCLCTLGTPSPCICCPARARPPCAYPMPRRALRLCADQSDQSLRRCNQSYSAVCVNKKRSKLAARRSGALTCRGSRPGRGSRPSGWGCRTAAWRPRWRRGGGVGGRRHQGAGRGSGLEARHAASTAAAQWQPPQLCSPPSYHGVDVCVCTVLRLLTCRSKRPQSWRPPGWPP